MVEAEDAPARKRYWPTHAKSAAAAAAEPAAISAVPQSGGVGQPVFCHTRELEALRCMQRYGNRNAAECSDQVASWKECLHQQKENVKRAVIDCSAYHTVSLRCLEMYGNDKDHCNDAFLE